MLFKKHLIFVGAIDQKKQRLKQKHLPLKLVNKGQNKTYKLKSSNEIHPEPHD